MPGWWGTDTVLLSQERTSTPLPHTGSAQRHPRKSRRTALRPKRALVQLPKAPSGIQGLDEITGGGLPRGRPTLVCGGAGCGKTLFAMEFLVRGAVEHGEPGVFMSFEESDAELAANVAALGFDVPRLVAQKKIVIDHVLVERSEVEQTGAYDLEGLFVRLQLAIETVGAKRVVLDTLESLFGTLPDQGILRSELRRLFRWLKDRGMTVVITGEKGEGTLTRHGLEEYVSDCVIFLDHRSNDQVSTRRLRVVKYRGSVHGTNEYPFLIGEDGFSVLPITSLGLRHKVSAARISTGLPRLDEMLGSKGYFKGTTILASGTAGTGKTSIAAHLAHTTCQGGGRCLYFAFEESSEQIMRNMRSIGLDLAAHEQSGLLRIVSARPYAAGLETHLAEIHKAILAFGPAVVIIDPVTNLASAGHTLEAQAMLTRLVDFLKCRTITTFLTSLTAGGAPLEETGVNVSSLVDTWIVLEVVTSGGERNRVLNIVKSRGMPHSNQTAEYRFTRGGIQMVDTYTGSSGVVTGSARRTREAEDRAAAALLVDQIARHVALRRVRQRAHEARLAAMQEDFVAEDAALEHLIVESQRQSNLRAAEGTAMARSRQAFARAPAAAKAPRTPP